MTKELAAKLQQYELLIYGVLKAGGVYRHSVNFEDYLQELRLLVLKRLLAGEVFQARDNPTLFKWLLWRLRDLQRGSQRYETRHLFTNEMPEVIADEQNFIQLELLMTIDKLISCHGQATHLKQLVTDFVMYPDDTVIKRCLRLKMHRMTYYRRLKLLQQVINENHYA
ncbi:hypothetical protein [Weissella sagaensis]|jgi:hypothetical protein|uniref:Sigma-70 family RNA polymerase sigma factor n=1 Tax=Weissella sagaensis TaxID=2559928 RepID=A0ABW1RV86_9LACO|nr:hypothetical protein [Weissella sagaensis]KAA8434758.1 hypothetical protein FKV79_02670 [Weissella paramesenteroides]QDJ59347.1 hypothetical protein EFA59_07445 [Weissella hellenica]KAA8437718.1 hypothetical protein FKV73_06875 [Weissella paramesenteroides]QEA56659.1 hypothetical protein FGL75_01630 [Weissella hellenica]UEG67471.1 hypothetical protein GZH44_02890 [Weissella hellenica]